MGHCLKKRHTIIGSYRKATCNLRHPISLGHTHAKTHTSVNARTHTSVHAQSTDFDSRLPVLIEMFVTASSFLFFRMGHLNDLGINRRVVPVEVEIHKSAILVVLAVL